MDENEVRHAVLTGATAVLNRLREVDAAITATLKIMRKWSSLRPRAPST